MCKQSWQRGVSKTSRNFPKNAGVPPHRSFTFDISLFSWNTSTMKLTCSNCNNPNDRIPQRYCKKCHAGYMRETRPKHKDLPEAQRKKANARAYANTYLKRGLIQRQPCSKCGADNAEKHHDNYDKPLEIKWLCRSCHLQHHSRPC